MATAEYIAPPTHNGKAKHAPAEFAHSVVKGFTRAHLAQLFAKKGYRRGAEIGVADGRYSMTLCQSIPNLQLYCVDAWKPYRGNTRGGGSEQHDRNLKLAVQRLESYGVIFVRQLSMDAVKTFPLNSLDFVYIDANHDAPYVGQDIEFWAHRVRVGGIVSGHDFYHFAGAGVVEAVDAYTKANGIDDWSLCDEREPSFWWVKK